MKVNKKVLIIVLSIVITFSIVSALTFAKYKSKQSFASSLQVSEPIVEIGNTESDLFKITEENTDDSTGVVTGNLKIVVNNFNSAGKVNETKAKGYVTILTDGKYDMSNFNFDVQSITVDNNGTTSNLTGITFDSNGKSSEFDILDSKETITFNIKVTCKIQNTSDYINTNKELKEDLYAKVSYVQVLPEKESN